MSNSLLFKILNVAFKNAPERTVLSTKAIKKGINKRFISYANRIQFHAEYAMGLVFRQQPTLIVNSLTVLKLIGQNNKTGYQTR